jgi:hypothetical protein
VGEGRAATRNARSQTDRPSVCSPLLGAAARSGMTLPLLGPAPDSATWAPGATPLARKQKNAGGNKKRKEGRRRKKRRKFRGHRRRCVERCRHRLGSSRPRAAVLTTDLSPPAPRGSPRTPTQSGSAPSGRVGAVAGLAAAPPPPPRSRAKKGGGCNTRTSREVTHPSTTLAQARLTAEF